MTSLAQRLADAEGDRGSAIVEFVFVAVVVLVPLIYLIVAIAQVQRSQLAVAQAAREVGRAVATGDGDPSARASAALRIALADQDVDGVELRFVAAAGSCDDVQVQPSVRAGAQFAVCVTRHVSVPGVPSVLQGRGVTTVGRYVVHVDDFRAAP